MDKLTQYINNHRVLLEDEPADGHFERFLQKQNRHNHRRQLYAAVRTAAVVIIIIALSAGIFFHRSTPSSSPVVACEQTTDLSGCYRSKIENMATQIETLTSGMDAWNKQTVITEVDNILESTSNIETLLPESLSTRESNRLRADYYQNSLETLQTIAQMVIENNNQ